MLQYFHVSHAGGVFFSEVIPSMKKSLTSTELEDYIYTQHLCCSSELNSWTGVCQLCLLVPSPQEGGF